jgi:transcriptional regulator GlxA family with amidase domain
MIVGVLLFTDMEELDFAGPWEVFGVTRMLTDGGLNPVTVAERAGPVRAAKGLRVLADHGFDDAPPLDVLLVPGGHGTRDPSVARPLVDFIQRTAPRCAWVTSVCTGALLLEQAGLLQGRRATTNRSFLDKLAARGNVTVLRGVRYVRDGNVVTSAGVSAGIDMSLWLVGQLFDPDTARRVQSRMEYEPAPPYSAEV